MKFQYTTRGLLKIFVLFAILFFGINYLRSVDWKHYEIARYSVPGKSCTFVISGDHFWEISRPIHFKTIGDETFNGPSYTLKMVEPREETSKDSYGLKTFEPEELAILFERRMKDKDDNITLDEIEVIVDLKTGDQLLPHCNQELIQGKSSVKSFEHIVSSNDHPLWKRILRINLNRE